MTPDFILRDNQCPICRERGPEPHPMRIEYRHEDLLIAVEVCRHCTRPFEVADDLIGDVYGDEGGIYASRNYDDGFSSAVARHGDYAGWKYYWRHLVEEIDHCMFCSEPETLQVSRLHSLSRWVGDEPKTMLGGRYCLGCKRLAVDLIREFEREEVRQWLRQQEQQREDQRNLRKLKSLFAKTRKALRENQGLDALQSLREEYELVASSPQ